MCFSATASFGAGIILSTIGAVSLKQAQTPSQRLFAGIPIIFSVQQITEGFLWLALTHPEYASLQQFTTYNFLFIAQVLWPVWVPLSILMLEKHKVRRWILKGLVGVGILVSCYLAYCLIFCHVQANIIGRHISYLQDYPLAPKYYSTVLYLLATIVPPFLSSIKKVWMVGSAILISCLITYILYTDYIVSVWCFFASIISILVLVVMYENKTSYIKPIQVA